MAILNYTTEVSAERTAGEIQARLVKAKARAVMMEYDPSGVLTHLSFRIDTKHGDIAFRLPAHIDGIYAKLSRDSRVPRKLRSREQAARVAWRICKAWIEAQLAVIEAGMAELAEVFLPYAQLRDGRTVYEHFESHGLPALTHDPSSGRNAK